MKNLKIRVLIDRNAAIRAGSAQYGECVYTPSNEELSLLTDQEREELTQLSSVTVGDQEVLNLFTLREAWENYDQVYATAGTWTEIRRILGVFRARRIEIRAQNAAKKELERLRKEEKRRETERKVAEAVERIFANPKDVVLQTLSRRGHIDTFSSAYTVLEIDTVSYEAHPEYKRVVEVFDAALAVVKAEVQAEKERKAQEEKAQEEARQAAIRTFLVTHASSEEVEIFDRGLLGETRIKDLARAQLFDGIQQARYERIVDSDIEHEDECSGYSVSYDTTSEFEMTLGQYRALKRIEATAPEGSTVEVRQHVAECDGCSGRVERLGALVTVTWNGYKLSREYAL